MNFFAEVIKIDSACLICIKLFQNLVCLLLSNVEPTTFNNSLDFVRAKNAIAVEVNTVESLIHVEMRVLSKSLSDRFGSNFYFEVNSPHIAEFNLCV